MKTALSCMKNEALFVTEWIAWHLLRGFDQIIIYTNDCSDGTDQMLDLISQRYPVLHMRNPMTDGLAPQASALADAFTQDAFLKSDWVLHCDADEFLRVETGDQSVSALIEHAGPADCIALLWRYYGDSGLEEWPCTPMLQTLRQCERRPRPGATMHKSLFRPAAFRSATDHMPKSPKTPDIVLRTASGEILPNDALFHPTQARHRNAPRESYSWEGGFLAHYAIRSRDLFLLKNQRGDGMGRETDRNHIGGRFWHRANRNDMRDRAIRPLLAPLRHKLAEIFADPELRALFDAAKEDLARRRATYLTPENIARWTQKEPAP